MSGPKTNDRPKGISATALAIVSFNLLGLIFVKWNRDSSLLYVQLLVAGITLTAMGVVVWFYLNGRNWARWIVMLQAIFPIVMTIIRRSANRPILVEIVDSTFGLFMLYWLNTRQVRSFFSNFSN